MFDSDRPMSWRQRLEISMILCLNRFFPRPRFIMHTEDAARKAWSELQEDDLVKGKEVVESLAKWISFEDRVVLDLGCGRGINAMGCAASAPEARLVIGVDVDAKALETAPEIRRQLGVRQVAFVIADGGALPLKDESIDIVVSVNAFEHVPRPQAALQEAARVLKGQGILSLQFFPLYYSRFGPHLWDYLCIPWVHLWTSPEAVAKAYCRIIEAETPRLLSEFAGRYDEEDIKTYFAAQIRQFTSLNKMTPGGFYSAVATTGGWRILHFALIHTSRLERILAYLPGLDRFMIWGIHCVLQRNRRGAVSAQAFTRWRWRQDLAAAKRKLAPWTKAIVRRRQGLQAVWRTWSSDLMSKKPPGFRPEVGTPWPGGALAGREMGDAANARQD